MTELVQADGSNTDGGAVQSGDGATSSDETTTTLAGGAIVAVAVVLQATADVRAAPRPVSEAA